MHIKLKQTKRNLLMNTDVQMGTDMEKGGALNAWYGKGSYLEMRALAFSVLVLCLVMRSKQDIQLS